MLALIIVSIACFAAASTAAIACAVARRAVRRADRAVADVESARAAADAASTQLEAARIHGSIDRTRRRQVEAVFDVLRDAILVTDANGDVLHANTHASRLLSVASADAAGRPVADVVSDRRLSSSIETASRGHAGDGRSAEQEIQVDGEPVAFEILRRTVGDEDEPMRATVTVLRDLSEEREIARLKGDFVSKASHELRTPLSSIAAYIEMLVDGDADDEASRQDFYRVIQTETDRLKRLVDNLLNISRIEAGLMCIDRTCVDIGDLVQRAVTTLGPQAAAKRLEIHARPSADIEIDADEDMLYQVLVNLLSNAIKYTPDGGRITMTCDADNLARNLHVSVADTGLGIPPDEVDRIFEKFHRIENYQRLAEGTGLGLNLCRHIVETLHGGRIGVESTLGKGSRFWFSVPMGQLQMSVAA